MTFVFRGLQQVELAGAIFYDFQNEKRKERSNPKESTKILSGEKLRGSNSKSSKRVYKRPR